jgi:hypothetical protein
MHSLSRIFLIVALIFTYFSSVCQNFQAGVYSSIGKEDKKIVFYSTNGVNYVVAKDYIYEFEDGIKIKETLTQGLVKKGMEMNHVYGPFATFGREGYFYSNNGNSYYYDELLSAYESNISEDPSDTLNYVYVKIAELPVNWQLKPENRLGELGVVNESILYEISQIDKVEKINEKGCFNCIYFEGRRLHDVNRMKYLMSEKDFYSLEITKKTNFYLTDLLGKNVQMFFNWENGRLPGYVNEETYDLESNKSTVPFDIQLLNESFNAHSSLVFPTPK